MLKRILVFIRNEKGASIIGYIVVISVTVAIAAVLIPHFNQTADSRSNKIINVFNSTDTIVELE
ncbi:hypothetical protein [Sedimentibacter sp. LTW-03]|uniref:hypothetical protein n=1 Tax=Sedimentibacter sp. LTW-03 TaxID=3453406 RepID=UPI003F8345AC